MVLRCLRFSIDWIVTYLKLSLSEREVNRENIVGQYLIKRAYPSLKLLIKRLEVEPVQLQTANQLHLGHSVHILVLVVHLRVKWHKQWNQQ